MESKDFIHHETSAAAAGGNNSAATTINSTFSAGAASSHPLQDVDLSLDAAATEPEIANTKTVNKNWVKFDDEANDVDVVGTGSGVIGGSGGGGIGAINENNKNNANNKGSEGMPTTAATTLNKLSPPPPVQPRRSTSPTAAPIPTTTTATATATSHTQPEKQTVNKHSAAVAPVQRQTVSSSTTTEAEIAPAVLTTESTHVNLNASGKTQHQQLQQQQHLHKPKAMTSGQALGNSNSNSNSNAGHSALGHHNNNGNNAAATTASSSNKSQSVTIPVETAPAMRTIELSTGRIREGFANGDVIVTLLPANTKWPWITPAIFRPELVPEELMAQGLTLTVEEYVNAMETLVNDYRFTVYNICYKRILVCWILFAFAVLLALLFSGLQGVALFSLGVGWLFLNAAAIFLCMWVKLRLSRGLEKCLARVNKQLMRHKILLVLDDRGRISCHKVNLCFLYFDATQCISYLNEFLEHTEQNGGEAIKAGWEAKLDIDVNDIVIQGNNPVRLSRKQERGNQLFLRYGSRWGMEALRGQCDVTPLDPGRHCGQFQCPCQYIKQHLQCKPRGYPCSCCAYLTDPNFQNRY